MYADLHEIITAVCTHRGKGIDPDFIYGMVKDTPFRDRLSLANSIMAHVKAAESEDIHPENGHDPFGVNL